MNSIHRIFRSGVAIERVDVCRATMNEAHEMFRNLVDDIIDYNKVVVDLSACDYIDSTFFGVLISAYRKLMASGGTIVLILGKTFLYKSYIYKDIASIFKVYHSVKEALHALQNPANLNTSMNDNDFDKKGAPANIVQLQLMLNPE